MKPPLANAARLLTRARIRAIAAVSDVGSFAAAGRQLGVSHSAVSQQIREMEKTCGIRLFDRTGGVLQPTPICQELTDIGQRILDAEREAGRILDRRDAQGKPRLRLGLGNSMPGIAIARALLEMHPGLSIAIQSGSHHDIMAAVLRRDVEVAVLPDVPPDPRFRRAAVLTQEVVAIVATEGPWQGHHELTLAELASGSLIFRSRGSSTQKVVDRAFRRAGLAPEPRLTADTRDAVYEAVALGIGAGFMWRHGTFRTDTVRRLTVPDFSASTQEVVFALADEKNEMVDLFFSAAADYASSLGRQRSLEGQPLSGAVS
jgi:DNA-binding transcriptional LysR family regulator